MGQNDTAQLIGYAFTTACSGLSTLGCLTVVFVILLYGKQSRQSERLVLGLSLAHIAMPVFDLRPLHTLEHNPTEFAVLAGLFEGFRFVTSFYEIFILIVSLSAVKRKLALEGKLETAGHFLCWTIGCAVGVGSAIYMYLGKDTFAEYRTALPDDLTYVWLILVLLSLLPFVLLEREVSRQEHNKRFAYDPDMDSKMDRLRKERLAELWAELMTSTVRPLRAFPIIFFLSALGEIGLMVLRHQNGSHEVLHIALSAAFSALIDVRGFLNTLAYFRNQEARDEISWVRLKGQMRRHRRRLGRPKAKVKFGTVIVPPDAESRGSAREDEMNEVNTPLLQASKEALGSGSEEEGADIEQGDVLLTPSSPMTRN